MANLIHTTPDRITESSPFTALHSQITVPGMEELPTPQPVSPFLRQRSISYAEFMAGRDR